MFKCNDSSSEEEDEAEPTIEKSLVLNSKIEIEHLICSICHHILWRAISCGALDGCHSVFCEACMDAWSSKSNLMESHEPLCPHCKRVFVRSQIPPIMKSILESLQIRCLFHPNGCTQTLAYPHYALHLKSCCFKMKKCQGCKQLVLQKSYSQHIDNCDQFMVVCDQCSRRMSKAQFISKHCGSVCEGGRSFECYEHEITSFGAKTVELQQTLEELNSQAEKLEAITKCFLMGEPLQLYISFYTTFNQHFVFPNPTLIKPSFNEAKEKFDFLHFYIVNPIYTNSIISMKWTIKISKMIGNILLGFCSSMNISSLDYIVNKYGELKRKDIQDNKYKIVKKNDFYFGQGDLIRCRYISLLKTIKIQNQTKRLEMSLNAQEIDQFVEGEKIFVFYSMDTLNDSISFLP